MRAPHLHSKGWAERWFREVVYHLQFVGGNPSSEVNAWWRGGLLVMLNLLPISLFSPRTHWSSSTRRGVEAESGLTGLRTQSRRQRNYPQLLSEVTQGFQWRGREGAWVEIKEGGINVVPLCFNDTFSVGWMGGWTVERTEGWRVVRKRWRGWSHTQTHTPNQLSGTSVVRARRHMNR